ncbi:MAG: GTP-binding protein, partial [Bacteroidia bacterium]
TDGLIAEREQGITIDVAHIYMTHKAKRIIWADSPGHEQYTRNMVTAASNSSAAMILTDISRPLTAQFERHFDILQTLQIPDILVVINKIDSIGYDKVLINRREAEIRELVQNNFKGKISFIPASAVEGINLVNINEDLFPELKLSVLDWIERLETVEEDEGFYAQVQQAVHLGNDSRRYHLVIYSGVLKVNELVFVPELPGKIRVKQLYKFGEAVDSVKKGEAASLEIDSQVDLSRGSILCEQYLENQFDSNNFEALIYNLDTLEIQSRKPYIMQRGLQRSKVRIENFNGATAISMNSKSTCSIKSSLPQKVFKNSTTQSNAFILIDETSNRTVALGIIQE